MINSEPVSGKRCSCDVDIPAYLQNELTREQKQAFESHMETCSSCSREVEQYRKLIGYLLTPLPATPTRDLTPHILKRIQPTLRFRAIIRSPFFLRAAALFLCFVAAAALVRVLRPHPTVAAAGAKYDQRINAAIAWLSSAQETDGRWDAVKWGAQKNYTPGVTALAILAFLKQDAHALKGPRAASIRSALNYLIRMQNADGRIGPVNSGTPYNQGLATLALLEACRRQTNPAWEQAASRSLNYIETTQLASGGWGYPRTPGDLGNTSITVWQLQALLKAESMGRSDVRASLKRGMMWLNNVVDPDGHIGYSRRGDFPYGKETLTAAGALCFLSDKSGGVTSPHLSRIVQALQTTARQKFEIDYYRFYFMTHALRAAGNDNPELIAGLCDTLIACQEQEGVHAGSFETKDRWSSAGGRVYATAMAVLAL